MRKIDKFVNRYPLSKTLRFSLIPIGKTEETFNAKMMLEKDKVRSENYALVKGYIDRYHKHFIDKVLTSVHIDNVKEYSKLYFKSGKVQTEIDKMKKLEEIMRKHISKSFSSDEIYKKIFSKDIIENILPNFLSDAKEIDVVKSFKGFTTYFTGFNKNRENMYSADEKASAISYRCINDNLPKFLDNVIKFEKIKSNLKIDDIKLLNDQCLKISNVSIDDMFCVDYFEFVLSQSGIDEYNSIIGGYTTEKGEKIQGINELVNLYNQQVAGKDKSKKLPFITPLYNQILSDKEKISFVPEKFDSGNDVIASINEFYKNILCDAMKELKKLFTDFNNYNMSGIFVKSGKSITELSNSVYGNWDCVYDGWRKEYESITPIKKKQSYDKYDELMKKTYQQILSFSIDSIEKYGKMSDYEDTENSVSQFISTTVLNKITDIERKYAESKYLSVSNYDKVYDKKLYNNENAIDEIKKLLDLIKELEYAIKPLNGTGKEENKDLEFYGIFTNLYEKVCHIDSLYDKVRNYATQKPYSNNKIKLNFDNPQLLGGWAQKNENAYSSILLRKDDKYYLGIMDSLSRNMFKDYPSPNQYEDYYEKMVYLQAADPSKDVQNLMVIDGITVKKNGRKEKSGPHAGENIVLENLKNKYLPPEINEIRKKKSYSKLSDNYKKEDLIKFIDYYKARTIEYFSDYKFVFEESEKYNSFAQFTDHINSQAYQLNFIKVLKEHIDKLVSEGNLYLFQIYNKDFSTHSKGKENLHTMYFKMLFDERNLCDVVYKLNGEAEMFYREPSIKESEMVVHHANQPIKNKNPNSTNKYALYNYDIIKDKRYTKRQFSLHIPITINFKADGRDYINDDVRLAIKDADNNYVIGIDRGERNLLYISVIDNSGKIVEQTSLNEIINENNYAVDYHKLLDKKEKERDSARKSWGTVENIKELKEGYLSQVIHKICQLVIKYDAIIAMEDLNFGFKKGRFKVEKQVYQKFENMLASKLNLLIDKSHKPDENGGLLRAYQLTNKMSGVNKGRQNGIIFYVPAYLTSKIDPATGFVDLLHPKYVNIQKSIEFIENIDDIRYNAAENYFEFDFDYSKFDRACTSYIKKWTVCTYGERIINKRSKDKNDNWDSFKIVLTNEFKALFEKYNIDIFGDIKQAILNNTQKELLERFMILLANTMQLRNSITGDVDVDYILSPVKDKTGKFYDSRECTNLPNSADANGAFNIARKAMWAISVLKNTEDDTLGKADLSISNAKWLEYVQK